MNNTFFKNIAECCKYTRIMKYYGIEAQKRKLQEECAELIRAISRNDENNMLEEMADVLILIEQFKTVQRFFEKIEEIKAAKIERTIERLEAQEECCRAVYSGYSSLAYNCAECNRNCVYNN